jgi:hypothetical protein
MISPLACPQGVIQKIAEIHKLRCVSSLGLRLAHLRSDAMHWLHPDLGVSHVREKYEKQHPQEEWRYGVTPRVFVVGVVGESLSMLCHSLDGLSFTSTDVNEVE